MNAENNNQEMLELLSAYLDDELTEAQRERVEQMLAEDVRARSLLMNLRDASEAVSGLDIEEIPRNITDEVLYALERDTLLDGNEDLAVMAGERHLRMRQFMGAAGIMILVGAVVVVVFSIMKNPAMVESDLGPLAKNDVQEQVAAEGAAAEKKVMPGDENVVRFKSFGEAARSLGNRGGKDEPADEVVADAVEPEIMAGAVMAEEVELPKIPPMEEFVLPEAKWGSIKLSSEVAGDDTVVAERLKNLVSRYGGSYFTGSGSGVQSFAFVCKAEEFKEFYIELRDVLAGEIDLVLDGSEKYRQVTVKGVSGDEVCMIAKLADGSDQLGLAEMIVPDGRIKYQQVEDIDDRPLWAQLADIVPEEYRLDFGKKLNEHFGAMEAEGVDTEGLLVASAEGGIQAGVGEGDSTDSEIVRGRQRAVPMKGAIQARRISTEPAEKRMVEEGVLSVDTADDVEKKTAVGFVANEAIETTAADVLAEAAAKPLAEKARAKVSEKVEADYIAVEILLTAGSVKSEDKMPDVPEGEIDGRIDFGF